MWQEMDSDYTLHKNGVGIQDSAKKCVSEVVFPSASRVLSIRPNPLSPGKSRCSPNGNLPLFDGVHR